MLVRPLDLGHLLAGPIDAPPLAGVGAGDAAIPGHDDGIGLVRAVTQALDDGLLGFGLDAVGTDLVMHCGELASQFCIPWQGDG